MEFSCDAGDTGLMYDENNYPTRCLSSMKTSSSWLCDMGSTVSDCDWRKGGGGTTMGGGDDGGDAMAAPCRGHGSDLVVAAINSMDDEDTAKFVLKLEAVL